MTFFTPPSGSTITLTAGQAAFTITGADLTSASADVRAGDTLGAGGASVPIATITASGGTLAYAWPIANVTAAPNWTIQRNAPARSDARALAATSSAIYSYAAQIGALGAHHVVQSVTNAPPSPAVPGVSYGVGASPTGAWAGAANQIATLRIDGAWAFTSPRVGFPRYSVADNTWRQWSGSAWVTIGVGDVASVAGLQAALDAFRVPLTAPRTYFVRTDGNDTNTGLTNTAGGAFRNIQTAINVALRRVDSAGQDVTIKIANGTYTEALTVNSSITGGGRLLIEGDTVTPGNVTVSALTASGSGARAAVGGLRFTNAAFAGVWADFGAHISLYGALEFGPIGGHQIIATNASSINMPATIRVTGGAAGAHINAGTSSSIYLQGAVWTITGSPGFGAFINASQSGSVFAFSNNFSGTPNAPRYSATLNGVINTNSGGNQNYFPGTVAGTVASGGQYS